MPGGNSLGGDWQHIGEPIGLVWVRDPLAIIVALSLNRLPALAAERDRLLEMRANGGHPGWLAHRPANVQERHEVRDWCDLVVEIAPRWDEGVPEWRFHPR